MPGPGTLKVTVTIMAVPAAIVGALQVMVPPLPTAGAVQLPVLVVNEINGRPAGNVAVKTTAFAGWFCAFLICQVMVSVVVGPEVGPPFWGDPPTCRSVVVCGCARLVFKLNVLFAGAGSGTGLPAASLALTVAVSVMARGHIQRDFNRGAPTGDNANPGCTGIATPADAQAPWLGVPETNVAPAGTKSTTVTCGAKLGPSVVGRQSVSGVAAGINACRTSDG